MKKILQEATVEVHVERAYDVICKSNAELRTSIERNLGRIDDLQTRVQQDSEKLEKNVETELKLKELIEVI